MFHLQSMEDFAKEEGQEGFTNLSSASMFITTGLKPTEKSEATDTKSSIGVSGTSVMVSGIQPEGAAVPAVDQTLNGIKKKVSEVEGNIFKAEPLNSQKESLAMTNGSLRIKQEPTSKTEYISEFPPPQLAATFPSPEQIDSVNRQERFKPDPLTTDSSPSPSPSSSGSTIYHDPLSPPEFPHPGGRSAYMHQLEEEYPASELRDKVRSCYRQVKNQRTQGGKRRVEKSCGIDVIIPKFWPVKKIDPHFEQKTGLKSVLRLISDPETGFSNLTVGLADKLYRRFERQDWGATEEDGDDGDSFSSEEYDGMLMENERSNKGRHCNAPAPTNASVVTGPSSIPSASTMKTRPDHREDMRPPKRHSIYGRGKIMDGVWLRKNTTISTNNVRISRILDPEKEHPPANKLGHNGIQHGAWWPKQICLVRDGAHGCIQGGIYGTAGDGAFSIIVSGTYSDLDKDSGEVLLYSAPKPRESPSATKQQNKGGAKILRRSLATQKSVRVIRAASKHSEYAPKVGLRYDGLYTVASEEMGKTVKGVALALFKLVRKHNQPDIDKDTPSWKQQQQFKSVKLHY